MFESHPELETPPDEKVIWRYVDLGRLLSMLHMRQLHFSRLDQFVDKWEGTWPKSFADMVVAASKMTDDRNRMLRMLTDTRLSHHVNCWHESEHESAALWDLYSQSAGVAIRSTIGALKKAVDPQIKFFIGRVHYVDFSAIPLGDIKPNGFVPTTLKRKSFEHEREVRAIIWDSLYSLDTKTAPPYPKGIPVSVNLHVLIDAAYVSPLASTWLIEPLKRLFYNAGIDPSVVERSTLYDERIY